MATGRGDAVNDLPNFKYHPDPLGTGSIQVSETECICCGQARGYIYVGPVYALEELDECICPWCIEDGSANAKLGASFTDESGVGGYGDWDDVPAAVVATIAYRTPGFIGWQQEQWWTHCGDAAAFLGRAGRKELEAAGDGAVEAIRQNTGLTGDNWESFLDALSKDGSPTAYLFRCAACGMVGGYQDCH